MAHISGILNFDPNRSPLLFHSFLDMELDTFYLAYLIFYYYNLLSWLATQTLFP